ncbi:MAG: phosphatase PAP2 family protein [Mogibacterium sp.]|nr:phosphatase PAP2 family protein [Mogibacterium sp.]
MDSFTQFDGNLLIGIQDALNADWLTPIMKVITYFGEGGVFWICVCLLLLFFRKTRRLGIICSLALLFNFICVNLVIKPVIDRERPWVVFEAVHNFMRDPGDASFPSGHTSNAVAPAWAMFKATVPVRHRNEDGSGGAKDYDMVPCLGWKGVGADPCLFHRLGIAGVILAVLIGISRLYLGMHYPSDVICGFLIGIICATIAYLVFAAIERRRGCLVGSFEFEKEEE